MLIFDSDLSKAWGLNKKFWVFLAFYLSSNLLRGMRFGLIIRTVLLLEDYDVSSSGITLNLDYFLILFDLKQIYEFILFLSVDAGPPQWEPSELLGGWSFHSSFQKGAFFSFCFLSWWLSLVLVLDFMCSGTPPGIVMPLFI